MLTQRLKEFKSIKRFQKMFAVYVEYPTQITCKNSDCTIICRCSFGIRFKMDPNRIREKRQSKSERDREREERPHFRGAHEQLNIRVCSAALFPQSREV